MDAGSSYLPSELNAAYLWAQLEQSDVVFDDRMRSWNLYYERLKPLSEEGLIQIPHVPEECGHNAHMFYIKLKNIDERTKFIQYMKENGIRCVFHYIPLHSSPAGRRYGRFHGSDEYTTRESERLVRLPMYYGLSDMDIDRIIGCIKNFWVNCRI